MSTYDNSIISENKRYFSLASWTIPVAVATLLVAISFINFLLFHTLAEFFAITIAILTCVVAWNMYPFTRNNYLMFLGVGYFWIGVLDLLHTIAYKGMDIVPGSGANMSVQFWIGTRYLEALLLLSAPWFLTHSLHRLRFFILFGLAASAITLAISLGAFPEGFIPGSGLTIFKIYSEYVIIFLLALSAYYLYAKRKFLEQRIVNVVIVSIGFTMCAELAFTFYVSVYGISNLVGHIFKIFSFWLIFQAIIRTTLQEPFLIMSRGATTYDAIPDAAIVVDEGGVIRQANSEAYNLAGQDRGELIGKNNHELFHPKNRDVADCPICQAIKNNKELKALELKVNEHGRWFDFSLSKITGASNLNGTVEVIRDITQRKEAEIKVKELNALKNSIIDNLPLMLFVKDAAENRYIEWNKAAEDLSGILKEEMIGNNDFDFWPRKEAQFYVDKDNEVIREGKLLDIPQEPLTTKLKGVRTMHTKKIPIYDEEGKAKYLLGIAEDITDMLETQKMLSRSQKMDVVGQMSGGIAHDFNNQLGVILGYTELLAEQPLAENQLKWLAAVKNAAERCSELTRQLLVFSRKGDVDKESLNINNIISEMKEMIAASLTPAVKVGYYLSENLWLTEANKGSCQDAILNMVINARDAMLDAGVLMIETSNIVLDGHIPFAPHLLPGEYIQIMLSDSGVGMSKEVSEHIFEPFYTTKDVGKGTGLGLSMVYGFVKRCGGDILLDTDPGKGSTFRIYLPRSEKSLTETKHVSDKNEDFVKGHERILIVDDEPALLSFTSQILKGWGYQVFRAENAENAVSILNNTAIDLMFSDVVMPGGVSGYELAEKALSINPSIKILLTSGFAGKHTGTNDKFDLIVKPYKRKDLAERLRQILEQ
jgi:PAS domain S-box-containing protein